MSHHDATSAAHTKSNCIEHNDQVVAGGAESLTSVHCVFVVWGSLVGYIRDTRKRHATMPVVRVGREQR